MAVAADAKKVVNIQSHILVPKHVILTEEEVAEVLAKFNVTVIQLPVISATDPVMKTIGAKAGNVVKIERAGPTGNTFYYRRVA